MLKKRKKIEIDYPNGLFEVHVSKTKYGKFLGFLRSVGNYLLNQLIGILALIVSIIALLHSFGVINIGEQTQPEKPEIQSEQSLK